MKTKMMRISALAVVVGLTAALGIQAGESDATADTRRDPVVQVEVALSGELDAFVPSEIDLMGLPFTSFAPTGLVIFVR